MKPNRIAGTITFKVAGEIQACAGDFTFNLGTPEREVLIGTDGKVHGYKETTKSAFVEGNLRVRKDQDIKSFLEQDDIDAQLDLANGNSYQFIEGWCAGSGDVNTADGTLAFRFEAKSAEKV